MNKIAFILGAAVLVTAVFVAIDISQEYPPAQYDTRIRVGGAGLVVDVVDTPSERARGLAGRQALPSDSGMLFVFEEPTTPNFWMKDMLFAIDIIWIDNDRRVIGVEERVSPDTYPRTFSPPSPVRYVLETSAGWAERHTIAPGDVFVWED